jgi:hypothetical protein
MGAKHPALKPQHIDFIREQPVYFVSTAPDDGYINLSPKGLDSLHIIDETHLLWLNLTGSANETAAHLLENSRITLMFCAFEGEPLILRLYGHGEIVTPDNPLWESLLSHFPYSDGARQLIKMAIELVHTSCGFGVPLMQYQGQRQQLPRWIEKKGVDGIRAYQKKNNTISLNGKPTDISSD